MKFSISSKKGAGKGAQRSKNMTIFQRPSTKRKNSRNLLKRYFRLIR